MRIEGGCLCGALRYRADASPLYTIRCHCNDCRKESGAGSLVLLAVKDSDLHISGPANTYRKPADSGLNVTRTFCGQCGSTILGRPDALAGIAMIRAGTLDDDRDVQPTAAIYAASAVPWDAPSSAIKCFAQMPPKR